MGLSNKHAAQLVLVLERHLGSREAVERFLKEAIDKKIGQRGMIESWKRALEFLSLSKPLPAVKS